MKRISPSVRQALVLLLAKLSIVWVASMAFAGSSGMAAGNAIVPNAAVQSALQALISTNNTQMFSGTEEEFQARLEQLRNLAGQDKDLVEQLLYFHTRVTNEREAMLLPVIVEQLAISNETFAEVGLSLIDAEDAATRKLAFGCLTRTDRNSNGDIDFGRFETILREQKQNPPRGLIRYMYDRDPQAAVIAIARVYGKDISEPEISAKAAGNIKESIDYFAGRSEWWAHLYVAAMLEKNSFLQTPDLMKRLEGDQDPLVREILARLPALVEAEPASEEPVVSANTIQAFELHIPFENDKADIGVEMDPKLDEIAQLLKTNPQYVARIEGHTDKTRRSIATYSKNLTGRQAQAVLDYLVKSGGIDAARMTAVGIGFDSPKAPNDPESGNPENKRVIVYIKESP